MTVFGGLIPSSGSGSTQRTMTYRMLAYKYGNGYEQMLPDGANASIDTMTVAFDNLNATDTATLIAWLATNKPWVTWSGDGTVLPSTKTYSITADGYQQTLNSAGVNAFTFNVAQRF